MRIMTWMLAFSAAAVLCAVSMTAQEPGVAVQQFERRVVISGQAGEQVPITGDFMAISTDFGSLAKPVKNLPYSADAVSESVQMLTDGNRIVQRNVSQLARDGQGRTMRRDKLGAIGPVAAGQPFEITFINDPVAGVNWVLEAESKIARKMNVAVSKGPRVASSDVMYEQIGKAEAGQMFGKVMKYTTTTTRQEQKSESLGKRVIEGVECEGTKSTFTIPAGQIGNEQPIEVVSERWFSPELQVVVYSKRNDPRMGETTYKLTNLQRSEPSRLLFEVPSDYTVKEGQSVVHTVIKKNE